MAAIVPPYFPIIYVRGYAGNDKEIDDTVADPYMGFNSGATKLRQDWRGDVIRHYFESPLIRLAKDFGYADVYTDGKMMPPGAVIPTKSLVVYRYYDEQVLDSILGDDSRREHVSGRRRRIEDFADGLGSLILHLRDRICGIDESDIAVRNARRAFRVYLVAHSMGGLVCRCFLQNKLLRHAAATTYVDKVFTYATPHNGIDTRIIGNVPSFFSRNNVDNFNRTRMAEYLGLPRNSNEVNNLNGTFDARRFFCLVGTNSEQYDVAGGWSRRIVGPMSDGLVRIVNATVFNQPQGSSQKTHSPRAFVHRSHSGHFGIVNSEEGYQNLTRFLFGDVRVDGILDIDELSLPREIQEEKEAGKTIRASYHFEVVVKVRGARWDLHRRLIEEHSAVFRTFDDMFPKAGHRRSPHLFSVFLALHGRVKKSSRSLGFAIDLKVRVPDYEVDGILWADRHYEGTTLFDKTIIVEATPPPKNKPGRDYRVRYSLNDKGNLNRATKRLKRDDSSVWDSAAADNDETDTVLFRIPLASSSVPGLKGALRLLCRPWNRERTEVRGSEDG